MNLLLCQTELHHYRIWWGTQESNLPACMRHYGVTARADSAKIRLSAQKKTGPSALVRTEGPVVVKPKLLKSAGVDVSHSSDERGLIPAHRFETFLT
jgi:hypothetical protein